MHTVKAAEPESIRQPAQRRRKKRQRPDFDAPVFRLSALARVIRTQAAKKKGRKIDVDPAFPPEIRGVSDADLASTSAESPPARRPCVHQFKKWDKARADLVRIGIRPFVREGCALIRFYRVYRTEIVVCQINA